MRRALLTSLPIMLVAFVGAPATAQMAASLGKPLADQSLPAGTVMVRVVDGSPRKPMDALTVELVPASGKAVSARTNAQGRATFTKLAPGGEFVVKVVVSADGASGEANQLASESFRVPATGGLRFMLSPRPLEASGPRPRGGQGMPDPRQMTGIPRPDKQDPAGTLVIRSVQGELSNTEARQAAGATIYLVGYSATGDVTIDAKRPGDKDRVRFENLRHDGSVVYYALALYQRGDKVDRLVSRPIEMPPQVGVRLMLAGPSKNSSQPPADDLARFEDLWWRHVWSEPMAWKIAKIGAPRAPIAAPGEVKIRVLGELLNVKEMELVEIGRPDVVATSPLLAPAPSPAQVRHRFLSKLPGDVSVSARRIDLQARRGDGQPVGSVTVRLLDSDAASAAQTGATVEPLQSAATDAQGKVSFSGLDPQKKYLVRAELFGRSFDSPVVGVTAEAGAGLTFEADWPAAKGVREAVFRGLTPGPDHVYLARAKVAGNTYRSVPFQVTRAHGTGLTMYSFPRPFFGFLAEGRLDDDHLWFHVSAVIANTNREPMPVPANGLVIPLPDKFVSTEVQENMSTRVSSDPSTGLRWRGPIPPGPQMFSFQFALPTDNGATKFSMPLPFGTIGSILAIYKTPGMELQTPPKVQGTETVADGKPMVWFPVNVDPGRTLAFAIKGMPVRPPWQRWVRISTGLLVVAILLWGVIGIFRRGTDAADMSAELEERRQELLEQLVALEEGGGGDKQAKKKKRNIERELVAVYEELGIGQG